MKAEKEPEEFEFGCEDLTKDWFDEISDMEEPEEKIKCDENDFFDNEQDSVEPDSKPDKARTGGIWDWDSEDYWAYGEGYALYCWSVRSNGFIGSACRYAGARVTECSF